MPKQEWEQKPFGFFKEIPRTERTPERPLKPKAPIIPLQPPTFPELLRPLNITKRRFGAWVAQVEKEEGFTIEEVLSPKSASLVRLYLSPPWPNQEEVAAQVSGDPRVGKFKDWLNMSMARIIRRARFGPRALEILKPSTFLYGSIADYGQRTGIKLRSIDDLRNLSPKELQIICGNRRTFEKLKASMREYFPDWDPPVIFPDELPPEEAAKFLHYP